MVTGYPTLIVSHEPRRTYESGPNHVLAWVLENAWRLVGHFRDLVPEGGSYLDLIGACAPGLEAVRRFDAMHQVVKAPNVLRRPGPQAVKEASRSRRPIYVLASRAYQRLLEVEVGVDAAVLHLLNDTLLGPLHAWQRFELAVGLGIARALSTAQGQGIELGFFAGGGEPIAKVGRYGIHWQARTDKFRTPTQEPSEALTSRLLRAYGINEGADRPDLVLIDNRGEGEAVAVVEVKYFSSGENDAPDAVRAAVAQLVRYARGYRSMGDIETILDHSIVAVAHAEGDRMLGETPFGVPLLVDFEAIRQSGLKRWAQWLELQRGVATAA